MRYPHTFIKNQKSLWFYFKNIELCEKQNFLIVFDQFEELFFYPKEQIEEFKRQFHELTSIDIPDNIMQLISNQPSIETHQQIDDLYKPLTVKTVFAIRSDRLSLLNNLTDKIPDIQNVFYELKPLSKDQAINAIEKPALFEQKDVYDSVSFVFNNEAYERILYYLMSGNDSNEIETPQLQIICEYCENLIIESNNTKYNITASDLANIEEVFENYIDACFIKSKLTNSEIKNIEKLIEEDLIPNGIRLTLPYDFIKSKYFIKEKTLEKLSKTYLLQRIKISANRYGYEISHDSLVQPILNRQNCKKNKKDNEIQEIIEKINRERERENSINQHRYIGLTPFSTTTANLFFGRDFDIASILLKITESDEILLYSKSGVGKSSLINSGLIPILNNEYDVVPIRFKVFTDNNQISLKEKFRNLINKQFDLDNLETVLQKISSNKKRGVIFIFDQFEEVFSYPDSQLPELFHYIHSYSNKTIQHEYNVEIKLIISIRGDRLQYFARYANEFPIIFQNFYELLPLTIEQAREAIVKPASLKGNYTIPSFSYTDDAISRILSILSNDNRQPIETTQLQIVCRQIETIAKTKLKNEENKPIVIEVKDLPNFNDIFIDFYEGGIKKTKQPSTTGKFIEDQLILSNQRISLDEIVCLQYVSKDTLLQLVNSRILRAEPNTTGGISYELTHDILIEPIQSVAEIRRQKEIQMQTERERKEEIIKERRRRNIITAFMILLAVGLVITLFQNNTIKKQSKQLIIAKQKVDSLNEILDKQNNYLLQSNELLDSALEIKTKYSIIINHRLNAANSEIEYLQKILFSIKNPYLKNQIDTSINKIKYYSSIIKLDDTLISQSDIEQIIVAQNELENLIKTQKTLIESKPEAIFSEVLFRMGSYQIEETAVNRLDSVINVIEKLIIISNSEKFELVINIWGYTDETRIHPNYAKRLIPTVNDNNTPKDAGQAQDYYNKELSKLRAISVQEYISNKIHIDGSIEVKYNVEGKGTELPDKNIEYGQIDTRRRIVKVFWYLKIH